VGSWIHGKLIKALKDSNENGRIGILSVFRDGNLVYEEKATYQDGFFDLRTRYRGDQVNLREADTNHARRVDVCVYYENDERARQEQDSKLDAHCYFQDGQLTEQETVAEIDPITPLIPFPSADDILRTAGEESSNSGAVVTAGALGLRTGAGKK
jgi:hypothetical protein